MKWVLLIYSLPTEPTRKRAFVWRELKKVGAVYLRDGVCVLPDRPDTRQALQAIAARVRAFEGQAAVVEEAHLDDGTAEGLVAQASAVRQAEYAAVVEAGEALLSHLRREIEHRAFTEHELATLGADLVKLRRWCDQIRGRDYFETDTVAAAQAVLAACEETLAGYRDTISLHAEVSR